MQEPARVRLEMESHPENVALVRAALSGVAEAAELGDELTADLKTAVSEACNNVALHAYDGSSGPMIVDIEIRHNGIGVVVCDHGRGITRISGGEDRMGLGLAVVSALADRAEFVTPKRGGTEVRMWFERETAITRASVDGGEPQATSLEPDGVGLDGEIVAWFTPAEMTPYVLGRIFRSVAASSHFSVSRVSDLRAVNDAIAGYVDLAADGGVGVAISSSSRRLVVTGGPFIVAAPQDPQTSSQDAELEHRREILAGVVDTLSSERLNEHELLHMEFVDSSRDTV